MNSSREIKVRFWYRGRAGSLASHVYTLDEIMNGEPIEGFTNNKFADWRMLPDREQFTGLRDERGRGIPIYHGDIVQIGRSFQGDFEVKAGPALVDWIEFGWSVCRDDDEVICDLWEAVYNLGAKVIGNGHENPELLEVVPDELK